MVNIHGFILINKDKGITSRSVIDHISKSLKIKKVGHAGTLDPLASGLLPVAIGEATKIISFVQNMRKFYTFRVNWESQQRQMMQRVKKFHLLTLDQ